MSVFPLNIPDKEDHPDKTAKLEGVESKYFETADEINKKTAAIQENRDAIIAIAKGTGERYDTLAIAMATDPLPEDNTPFVISAEPGANGQYYFDSTQTEGYYLVELFISKATDGETMAGSSKYFDGGKTVERIKEELLSDDINDEDKEKGASLLALEKVLDVTSQNAFFKNAELNSIFKELYIGGYAGTDKVYLSSFRANGSHWYIEFSTWNETSSDSTRLIVKSFTLTGTKYLFESTSGITLFAVIDWDGVSNFTEIDDVDYSESLEPKTIAFDYSFSSTYSRTLIYSFFGQKGVYYGNGYSVGDVFKFKATSSSSSFNSIVFLLKKSESINFNYIAYASASSKIYVIDLNGKVSEVIDKTTPDVILKYTATEDCYLAFSSNRGALVYDQSKPIDVSSFKSKFKKSIKLSNGFYLNSNGLVAENDVWSVSGFEEIGNKSVLYFPIEILDNDEDEAFSKLICFYKSDLSLKAGLNTSDLTVVEDRYVKVTVPVDSIFYRLNINTTQITSMYEAIDALEDKSVFSYNIAVDFEDGFYLNSNGLKLQSGAFKTSKFIPLNSKLANYYLEAFMGGGSATISNIAFYGSEDESSFIESVTNGGEDVKYNDQLGNPLTAGFVRFSTPITHQGFLNLYTDSLDGLKISSESESEKIDIVVPKYLDCPIGRNTDIFLDHIIGLPDGVNTHCVSIVGNSSTGIIQRVTPNQLRVVPTTEVEVVLTFQTHKTSDLSVISNSKDLVFRCVPRNNGSGEVINMCISGDSLVQDGWAVAELYSLLAEDADFTINQIGTIQPNKGGTVYNHEARGGWSWNSYLNPTYENTAFQGKTNAFMINGELNFQAYMAANFPALSGMDLFIMSLGTNDITQGDYFPSDERISEIITDAKTFIDTLLSVDKGYPNCKVVVGLPGVGSLQFPNASLDQNFFKMGMQKLNRAYIDTFDNAAYHSNITTVMHGAFIERVNSYQYEDIAISDYVTDTTRRYINAVHPLQVGYEQWGRGYYNKVRAFLNGDL